MHAWSDAHKVSLVLFYDGRNKKMGLRATELAPVDMFGRTCGWVEGACWIVAVECIHGHWASFFVDHLMSTVKQSVLFWDVIKF